MAVDERLAEELRRRASDGCLPCAAAFEIAERLGIPRRAVGDAANELGIKIVDCQLGCFGRGKARQSSGGNRRDSLRYFALMRGHVLCIVGRKGVGKTTLIERLVPELKRRGRRVATVKRPPHPVEVDTPGTDSFRHFHAGADATLLYAEDKLVLFRRCDRLPEVGEIVSELLSESDLVLVEGHKSSGFPKIEVFRAGVHSSPLYHGQPDYLAIASDTPLDLGIPRVDLADPAAIADFIVAQFPRR